MDPRRKSGLAGALCVALTSLAIPVYGGPFGEQAAGPAPAAQPRRSDWMVQVKNGGTLAITHKGAPVLSNELLFWGPKWLWVGADTKATYRDRGELALVTNVRDLKLKIVGDIQSPAPNVVRMDLDIQTEAAMPDVIGGGWQWNFQLNSPSFAVRPPDPELLPGNAGWTWRVGDGQAITLRLEGGFAKAYFERDQKNTVRTFFVAGQIEPATRRLQITLELPKGTERMATPEERYDRPDPKMWFPGALAPDGAPVDLSFLNRDDRPAGRRGFVRADGDRLVFADGSPARFWGGNLAAYPLFSTPRQDAVRQAHRMARLGYNLMRIHHHDSDWVAPNVFGPKPKSTLRLDGRALDSLDWWIKCLKEEGIYVWLDMHVGRAVKPLDGLTAGAEEVARQNGSLKSFCYYNSQLQELLKGFQHEYLNHLNRYTGLRYKDDPAVVAVLVTNENDMTQHGCYSVLPDKKNPFHNALWTKAYQAFAKSHGLPAGKVFQTWVPGPSKLFLAEVEHEFNETMIADLRETGVKSPVVTTNFWGNDPLYSLPSLTDSDLIDVHMYGAAEELGHNAHYQGNFLGWIAMGQVYGKPLSVTEWNLQYPTPDRFIGPLYVASVAALQGWDAPMIYNYSQMLFERDPRPDSWSTFHDPAITAVMPAAALLFRRGHVSPAKKTYCFTPSASALFNRELNPDTSATVRTLAEQSKLTVGMPEVPELPWLKPTKPSAGVVVINDPDRDFIPEGQSFVRSDTGELTRDWERGVHVVDTPRTQAVSGWIGGETLQTHDARFETRTKKAVVVLSSVDDRPLSESGFILVTAVARAMASPGGKPPFLSEPVNCRITLRTRAGDLDLLALGRDGRVVGRPHLERQGDDVTFDLPAAGGTHWYVLKPRTRGTRERPPAEGTSGSAPKGS